MTNKIIKVNTREFNKLLRNGFSGYVIYQKRKLMLCRTIKIITDMKKRKIELYKQRRDIRLEKGLCFMCGKYKIYIKSKSRCKKCLEKARNRI